MGEGSKLYPAAICCCLKDRKCLLPIVGQPFFTGFGCVVWDLDKNKFIDMSRMGIGTNILGYGDPEVDAAVMRTVRAGNMSTLKGGASCRGVSAATSMGDMVKFARSGGEASAISIRIARAVTGRDHVAICGYHGWHDWYLSANLNNAKNLDSHLLPDLEPAGVPSALSGLVHPFEYNNFEQLSEIVRSAEIGVIKMEVERNIPLEEDFLRCKTWRIERELF